MATQLKLVSSQPDAGRRTGTPRPITTYYFSKSARRPLRIARSTTPTAALCAVIRRIGLGEPIAVAEVCNEHGKLLRTLTCRYGRITITR